MATSKKLRDGGGCGGTTTSTSCSKKRKGQPAVAPLPTNNFEGLDRSDTQPSTGYSTSSQGHMDYKTRSIGFGGSGSTGTETETGRSSYFLGMKQQQQQQQGSRNTTTTTTTTTKPPPLTKETTKDAMALLANEMNHLSFQERQQAYEDLHGVSETIQETPEFITQAIQKMKEYIQTIQEKKAYDLALSINNGEYVHCHELLIMFLRADRYNIELAAKRFITWLDWKLQLFGSSKLCQYYIGYDELHTDTKYMIESGFIQLVPGRDSCGRCILVAAGNYHNQFHRTRISELQMVYYMFMSALEDEMNQINGMVLVEYSLGSSGELGGGNNNKKKSQPTATNNWLRPGAGGTTNVESNHQQLRDVLWDSCRMMASLPIRIEALHFCMGGGPSSSSQPHHSITNNLQQYAFTHIVNGIGKYTRARIRVHFGSHIECVYALETFGIPANELLPFSNNNNHHVGELKIIAHLKWMDRRKVKDLTIKGYELRNSKVAMSKTFFGGIDIPNRNDILFGKGKPIQNHFGNQRLQELTRDYLNEYDAAGSSSRTAVAMKIVSIIKHSSTSTSTTTTTTTTPTSTNLPESSGVGVGDTGSSSAITSSTNYSNRHGGRFLQLSKNIKLQGWWEEVADEEIILEKVCNGLRNARRRRKKDNDSYTPYCCVTK